MKYLLLLLFTVKTVYGFGFGFSQAFQPLHMQLEVPAMPMSLMSPMPFPAIFNPMEAMQREEEPAEARGMDIDEPMSNITTKNKTEVKDGFKITTISSNGPGFHSYIKEYEKEGNSTKNGTSGFDLAKMMGGSNLFKIMQQLRRGGKPRERKCKKCGKDKFCDPIFHLCRKKFSEGRTCMFQKQCGKSLKCQWGKCQKAKSGDPGTFCKANAQCNGDACCRNTPGSFHLMCIPRQAEGAICGLKKSSFANVLYVVKRSTAPTCSPCQDGLKCADTGDGKHKRCVKDAYVEKAADDMEDENPSNAIDDDDDDESSGSSEEPNPLKGVPPKGPANTADKNPIDDKSENKWEPPPPADEKDDEDEDDDEGENDSDDKEEKKEDKDKDDDDDGDDDKSVVDVDTAIAVQKPPKTKGKGKERKGKKNNKNKKTKENA